MKIAQTSGGARPMQSRRSVVVRWFLFTALLISSALLLSLFAMCAEFADVPSLSVAEKRYWVRWANICGLLSFASTVATIVILIINVRWHLRSSRVFRA